jgi:hypothetical protein
MKKAAGSRRHQPHPTRRSRKSPASQTHNVAPLIPEGWAPGPAGEGTPYKLPSLVISLPECFTVTFVHEHYKAVRDQLRQQVLNGGHDALTVLINARMQTLAHSKARPNIILVSHRCIVAISY